MTPPASTKRNPAQQAALAIDPPGPGAAAASPSAQITTPDIQSALCSLIQRTLDHAAHDEAARREAARASALRARNFQD